MATTELISEQKSFLWKIPNFAEVLKSEELLKDQNCEFEMRVGEQEQEIVPLKWRCFLSPNDDDDEEDKDYFGMYIRAENLPPELSNAHARAQFRILGKDDYDDDTGAFSIKDSFDIKRGYGCPKEIQQRSKRMPFLSADGSLETRVTVTVFHHSAVQDAELVALEAEYENWFAKNHRSELSGSEYFLNTGTRIVSKDGKQFPADRNILAARSEVFSRMFQSDMSEGREGVVHVKDLDSKALKVLLHFIHKGELYKNWKEEGVIEGLVCGAHKYMMKDLMEFLDKVLGLVCTKENCGKLAGLAKAFGMKTAEKRLFEYFKKNLSNDLDQVTSFVQDSAMEAMLMTSTAEKQEENGEEPQPKRNKRTEEED